MASDQDREKIIDAETDEESNCCGAMILQGGICADCREHCEAVVYNCEICKDTGQVEIMGDDGRGNWDVVDIKRCSCLDD